MPPIIEDSVKQYLLDIQLAPILEHFVAACIADKPTDVYVFMESYAKRQIAERTQTQQWTLTNTWTEIIAANKESLQSFGDHFFQLLFIQQRVMKRTVFAKVSDDLTRAAMLFASLFGKCVLGELTSIEMAAMAAEHATDVPIEPYHFQALITTTLLALQGALRGPAWEQTAAQWREFCTELGARVEAVIAEAKAAAQAAQDQLQQERGSENGTNTPTDETITQQQQEQQQGDSNNKTEGNNSDNNNTDGNNNREAASSSAATETNTTDKEKKSKKDKTAADPSADPVQAWGRLSVAEQQRLMENTFDILLLQHPPLRRSWFAGIDLPALSTALVPLLPRLADDNITEADITSTGVVEAARQRGVQPYHIQYCITALLMSMSGTFGKSAWNEGLSEPWRLRLTRVGDMVERMIIEADENDNNNDNDNNNGE